MKNKTECMGMCSELGHGEDAPTTGHGHMEPERSADPKVQGCHALPD